MGVLALTIFLKPEIVFTGNKLYQIGLSKFKSGDHECYYDKDKVRSAISYFEKAVNKKLKNRDLYDKLADCYSVLGDKINYERIYTVGLDYFPNDAEFHYYRASNRKEMKNFNGALLDYDQAVSLDKNFKYRSNAMYERGAMRFILGDTTHAYMDLTMAQKITSYELRTYPDYCRLWR